jgi:hypothetical protein
MGGHGRKSNEIKTAHVTFEDPIAAEAAALFIAVSAVFSTFVYHPPELCDPRKP